MAKRSRADEDGWEENRKFVFDNIDKLGETLQGQYSGLGRSIERLGESFEKKIDKQSDEFSTHLLTLSGKLEAIKDNDLTHLDKRLDKLENSVTAINTKLITVTAVVIVSIPILIQVFELSVEYFKN